MELFDKLSDTLVTVSRDASQKAKDLSEKAKIRVDIKAKEDYINKQYLEIGRAYYEMHKDDPDPAYVQMDLIKEAGETLGELKQQLGELKGIQICPKCGEQVAQDAEFCSKCGAKLDIFEEE